MTTYTAFLTLLTGIPQVHLEMMRQKQCVHTASTNMFICGCLHPSAIILEHNYNKFRDLLIWIENLLEFQ